MKIGQALRLYRREAKMSPGEWADIFGVSESTVLRIERGDQKAEVKYLQEVQKHFDSEVLGAYICGINDYQLQRGCLIDLAKANNISVKALMNQYAFQ